MAKVYFARINRRSVEQGSLGGGTFAEEIEVLANSRRTRYEEPMSPPSHDMNPSVRRWTAADFRLEASGEFLTGTLGYSEPAGTRLFDEPAWSWVKATTDSTHGADDESVVPFAVDIRNGQRWVAFATTFKLRRSRFCEGFSFVLNQAVADVGLIPQAWDVDLITSRRSVDSWISDNPLVFNLVRIVKRSNPGRDLDEDRDEMRRLGARRKTEEYQAEPGGVLNINATEFRDKLDGTDKGNLELRMQARDEKSNSPSRYSSEESADEATVTDFGLDLEAGMDRVLAELRRYVSSDQ